VQVAFSFLYALICGVGIYLVIKAFRLRNSQNEEFLERTYTEISKTCGLD
jgi:hypothetical protein